MEGNPFVYYLDQYNVLSPNHSKIYDEYTHDENSEINYHFNVHTQIEDTLVDLFESKPQSVILTGNAGDGKTRLCRMIHNHFNEQNELTTWPEEGIVEFPFKNGKLRIVKDLSELKEDVIFRELSVLQENIQTQHSNKIYYLIAANEGKLTKFLSQHDDELSLLNNEVLKRFETHEHNSNQFSIFNLLDVTSSVYVDRVLEDWNKEENWLPCQSCPKQDRCIIYMNHKRTSDDHIQEKIVEQYQMLDYLDTHITLREMLIHISFMLTGGYTCEDVLGADYTDLKEQIKRPYYQNFYGQELSENAFSEMKALRLFKTLDPGNYSHSSIDDFIINGDINGDDYLENIYENLFGKTLDLELGYFQKKLALYRDYNVGSDDTLIDEWIPKLRRKFFYELKDNHILKPNQLLPYEYLSDYKSMFDDIKNQKAVKKVLIGGLNRVFSGRLTAETKHLYATNKNLMVYDTFKQNKDVKLIEESERYDLDRKPSTFTLFVDEEVELPLNLAIFEYLMRASGGGTHNILQQDAEILVDTFKNELIRISDADDYILNILRYDSNEGLFVEDEITLD